MLLILTLVLLIQNGSCKSTGRIYNGYRDDENKYSYVVCLREQTENGDKRYCSGVAVTKNWVITVAQCITVDYNITVTYLSNETTYKNVNALWKTTHPNYYKQRGDVQITLNDIGLIKVEEMLIDKTVDLSPLDYKQFYTLPVVFAGFGNTYDVTNMTKEETEAHLLELNPVMLGDGLIAECLRIILPQPVMCVTQDLPGLAKVTYPLFGDQGGALIYNNTVIGIIQGTESNRIGMLYVYAVPVNFYYDWVYDTIETDEQKTNASVKAEPTVFVKVYDLSYTSKITSKFL